ncbi:hypothetical protein [Polaromonas naphthalenivorans]|uniref:hypothetical protein n=1 Tax=Polaromonas naphthalenivorans TaxID=216465 RepID=UPI0002D9EF09|nr:hypothetical protein [Polaromonas naphthalenivorans]
MKVFILFASLALAGLLGGCSSEQFYASGQNWQRNECNKLLDAQERGRCMKSASTSYETYRQQAERVKP